VSARRERELMTTSAVTFVFDYSGAGQSASAFLSALARVDPTGRTRSLVGLGDPLVAELAAKITSVAQRERGSSYTKSCDMEVYRTLIWDLADAISLQWNTVTEADLLRILDNSDVHCITVPTLPAALGAEIDRQLRGARVATSVRLSSTLEARSSGTRSSTV
jgi:hypothetical protein